MTADPALRELAGLSNQGFLRTCTRLGDEVVAPCGPYTGALVIGRFGTDADDTVRWIADDLEGVPAVSRRRSTAA
ncbi:hypothetical protein [Streptomyces umbrinus]|uniref:hypothetical protein n=1 Tax=Streptomyces umbrinus TaxID=67370 RepID=UPI0033F0A29E